MRKTLIRTLAELAETDPRVLFLTADLGYTVVEPFAERFPDRFFNVGASEQNMLAVATGLAEGGFIPYVYSIAPFSTLRPYEFIRNGPVLQNLPVRIIGVGGGFEYAPAGPTHYALEDVGALRMLPGLKVAVPADFRQCRNALLAWHAAPGPAYFRLGKDEVNAVPNLEGRFEEGRLQMVRAGGEVLFLALGPAVNLALKAAEALSARGTESTVAVIASVSPAPVDDLRSLLSHFPCAVTVEAHYAVGGLGSLVCEVAAGEGIPCRILRRGVEGSPAGEQGDAEFMLRKHGLSPEALAETALAGLAAAPVSPVPPAFADRAPVPAGDWGPAPAGPAISVTHNPEIPARGSSAVPAPGAGKAATGRQP
jgi:transketolase